MQRQELGEAAPHHRIQLLQRARVQMSVHVLAREPCKQIWCEIRADGDAVITTCRVGSQRLGPLIVYLVPSAMCLLAACGAQRAAKPAGTSVPLVIGHRAPSQRLEYNKKFNTHLHIPINACKHSDSDLRISSVRESLQLVESSLLRRCQRVDVHREIKRKSGESSDYC